MMNPPTPQQVREARDRAGLSQLQAAALIYKTRISWTRWESYGDNRAYMDPALWELFLLKTGQIDLPPFPPPRP